MFLINPKFHLEVGFEDNFITISFLRQVMINSKFSSVNSSETLMLLHSEVA